MAKTAGELYGRALVIIAAEQHACRLVVPQSQRHTSIRWGSHNDRAIRALTKLTKGHLPASLTQIKRNVERAHRDADTVRQHASNVVGDETAANNTDTEVRQETVPVDELEQHTYDQEEVD